MRSARQLPRNRSKGAGGADGDAPAPRRRSMAAVTAAGSSDRSSNGPSIARATRRRRPRRRSRLAMVEDLAAFRHDGEDTNGRRARARIGALQVEGHEDARGARRLAFLDRDDPRPRETLESSTRTGRPSRRSSASTRSRSAASPSPPKAGSAGACVERTTRSRDRSAGARSTRRSARPRRITVEQVERAARRACEPPGFRDVAVAVEPDGPRATEGKIPSRAGCASPPRGCAPPRVDRARPRLPARGRAGTPQRRGRRQDVP